MHTYMLLSTSLPLIEIEKSSLGKQKFIDHGIKYIQHFRICWQYTRNNVLTRVTLRIGFSDVIYNRYVKLIIYFLFQVSH